ncbi:MAG: S8/S53 family peptidase, partial [Chloroflexi bacterium]|nr:S8/S53 family peptidase [Chloroflexota bacterium]
VQTYDPLLVAAAGNIPPDTPATFYPAQYDGVLAVTAVDTHDVWWGTVQIGYGIDVATTGAGTTLHSYNGTDHSYFKMGATTSGASAIASGMTLSACGCRRWRWTWPRCRCWSITGSNIRSSRRSSCARRCAVPGRIASGWIPGGLSPSLCGMRPCPTRSRLTWGAMRTPRPGCGRGRG